MKKLLMGCMVAVMSMSLLAGCSKPSNDDLPAMEGYNEKGYLVVGLDDTFAPMGFKDSSGEIVGFDVEMAKEIGKIIALEMKFQNVDWDLKETEMNAGNIDLIWNGYSITEERKEMVLFSDPYLNNRQIIIVLKDSGVKTKADLAGKSLSVQKNSSALDAVSSDVAFTATLLDGKPTQFETNNDCFMDLEAGRSTAIVVDEVLARYYMKQKGTDIYEVLEEDFGEEEYAIGMRKSDTELCEKINAALQELKDNGTFDIIKNKWFSE